MKYTSYTEDGFLEYEYDYPKNLLEIFPEAEGIVRTKVKNLIERICLITETYFNSNRSVIGEELFTLALEGYNKELNRNLKLLPTSPIEGKVDLVKARQRPITDFIEFNRAGMALCLWHNDNKPSMKYYDKTNQVHCFSCGKHGDVIDVVMQQRGVSFKEALKYF